MEPPVQQNVMLLAKRGSMMRDPLSKTLAISMCGIVALTIMGLTVTIGAIIKGNIGDGAIVGLISTIVAGISTCVTAVASRAQGKPEDVKAQPQVTTTTTDV